jgi:hypothetical protein
MELFVFLMVQTLLQLQKAEGTYTSVGNTFNATYTYSGGGTFSVTATVNSINAFMEGTWGSGTSTTSGKFFMHKP